MTTAAQSRLAELEGLDHRVRHPILRCADLSHRPPQRGPLPPVTECDRCKVDPAVDQLLALHAEYWKLRYDPRTYE